MIPTIPSNTCMRVYLLYLVLCPLHWNVKTMRRSCVLSSLSSRVISFFLEKNRSCSSFKWKSFDSWFEWEISWNLLILIFNVENDLKLCIKNGIKHRYFSIFKLNCLSLKWISIYVIVFRLFCLRTSISPSSSTSPSTFDHHAGCLEAVLCNLKLNCQSTRYYFPVSFWVKQEWKTKM